MYQWKLIHSEHTKLTLVAVANPLGIMRSSERLHYRNLSQRTLDYQTLLLFEKLLLKSWMWEKRRGGGGWQGNFGRTTDLKGGGALAAEGISHRTFQEADGNLWQHGVSWKGLPLQRTLVEGGAPSINKQPSTWWKHKDLHASTLLFLWDVTFFRFSVQRRLSLQLFELVAVILGKIPLNVNQILAWTFKPHQLLSDHTVWSVSFSDKALIFAITFYTTNRKSWFWSFLWNNYICGCFKIKIKTFLFFFALQGLSKKFSKLDNF